MVDQSVKILTGIFKDVLFKVEDFIFPIDFILLGMKGVHVQHQTLIILFRPFIVMVNVCIKCHVRIMNISFGNKNVHLNMFNAMIGPIGDKCISFVEADEAI